MINGKWTASLTDFSYLNNYFYLLRVNAFRDFIRRLYSFK